MADEKRKLRQLDGLSDYRTWRDVNINRVYSVPIVKFWMPVLMVVSETVNILRTTWSDVCTYQMRETSKVSIVDARYWLKGNNFHSWLSLERIRIGMSGTSVFWSRRTWLAFGNCQSHAEAAELRVRFQILYTLKDLGTESSNSGFIVIRSKLGRTKEEVIMIRLRRTAKRHTILSDSRHLPMITYKKMGACALHHRLATLNQLPSPH